VTIDISPKLNWRREQGTCSNSGAAGAIVYMRWNPGGDNEYLTHSEVLTYAPPTPTFLGFTGRTGGATNNHWARNIQYAVGGAGSAPAPSSGPFGVTQVGTGSLGTTVGGGGKGD
jgi:hypothetical protein